MPSKGAPIRTSYSKVAFSGSGGKEGNTALSKYSSKRDSLEGIICDSQKSINKNLEARARIALKYIHPGAYYGLLAAEKLYKHREIIFETIENVAEIWSEDTSISEKLVDTAGEIVKGGAEVAKDELKERLIGYVASEFSEEVVNRLEDEKIIDTIANEIPLESHKDRFKDLLRDTIEKQMESSLESVAGDLI